MPKRPTEDKALEPEQFDDMPLEVGEGETDPEPTSGGVYRINCLANGRYYFGRGRDLLERKTVHWNTLEKGDHHNQEMQDDYNEHGLEAFTFEILEEIPYIDDQKAAEQALLDEYMSDPKCYNELEWAGWVPT